MNINMEKVAKIKGFLDEDEACHLYELALEASLFGPCLEIGSYCGKSAVYIGQACKINRSVLFSVDHHCGSEEQQPGEAYFDPDLWDEKQKKIDTFKFFRQTISDFNLEEAVIPIIGRSELVGKKWRTPLSLVFIDGGHAYNTVLADYETWAKHILPGGYLIFHDIFPDPAQGGQAPYFVYRKAVASFSFDELPLMKSLGILKRKINADFPFPEGKHI